MALPYVFANVSVLSTPNLDSDFNALGALTIIPCTATGTNTIALTPAASTPTISAYTNSAPVFAFKAAASNSGAVTVNVSGVGAKNLYKNNGQTITASGDLIINALYLVTYNSSLNSGAGGWVLVNQGASAAAAGSVQGGFKNLTVTNTTASSPNTQVAITADALAVSDGSTSYTTLLSVSVTADGAGTVGQANGLDTGSFSASTWYFVYVIYNPTTLTAASLLSISATSPTLPTGYTQWARVGAMRTDGSIHFLYVMQKGRIAQYVIGTNPTVAPTITNGVTGTYSATSPTLASTSIATVAPSTAAAISVTATQTWKAGTASSVLVAPNTGWGGSNNGPSGSNGASYPIWLQSGSGGTYNWARIVLEATTLGIALSAAGGFVGCLGWEDNLT